MKERNVGGMDLPYKAINKLSNKLKHKLSKILSRYGLTRNNIYHSFLIYYLIFFMTLMIHSYTYKYIESSFNMGYFTSLVVMYIFIQLSLNYSSIFNIKNTPKM